MRALTHRQREAMLAIVDHAERHGYPPTIREIGAALGVTSNSVVCLLKPLEAKGAIAIDRGRARGIRVLAPVPAVHECFTPKCARRAA